jgi:hypothetical protein
MNIFILDYDIEKSARYHCDKHVVKMVLESAQLMCSVHLANGVATPYKMSKGHMNHPCAIWARTCKDNYFYLWEVARQLCLEYTFRYGKVHASQAVIDSLPWPSYVPDGKMTPFARAFRRTMPVENLNRILTCTDVVEAYRLYYILDKPFAKWNFREVPPWYSIPVTGTIQDITRT